MNYIPNRTGLADYLRNHSHTGGIIVLQQKKCIYMKPCKAAGTSILREGFQKQGVETIFMKDHSEQFSQWLENITDAELEGYFIFTVTRNPWSRFVSLAKYFNVPFKKLAFELDKYREQEEIRIHSLPVSEYTHVNGKPFVDAVCRTECLQADMNLVFDQIGLPRSQVAHANRTRHAHYSTYYTDHEKELVSKYYEDDIKNFGYSFEEKSKRFFFK